MESAQLDDISTISSTLPQGRAAFTDLDGLVRCPHSVGTDARGLRGSIKTAGSLRGSQIRPRLSSWPQFATWTASARGRTFTAGFASRCFVLSVPSGERDPLTPS